MLGLVPVCVRVRARTQAHRTPRLVYMYDYDFIGLGCRAREFLAGVVAGCHVLVRFLVSGGAVTRPHVEIGPKPQDSLAC